MLGSIDELSKDSNITIYRLENERNKDMLDNGVYVIGFSYPVVPKNEARIRVQISASHTKRQLDHAIDSFINVGKKYKII